MYRWRNERLWVGVAFSNALRHMSEQLGARSAEWNQSVFDAVLSVHHQLGMDPNDRATTWPDARYRPPRSTSHEADAANRLHFTFAVAAIAVLLYVRRREWIMYSVPTFASCTQV